MPYRPRALRAMVILLSLAPLPIRGWADDDDEVPVEQIVVTATRIPGLIRDEPLRVEAVPAVLANVNSRGGRDLEGFLTDGGAAGWSGTLTAGAHDQSREDVSGEGWADIPGYRRYTLPPPGMVECRHRSVAVLYGRVDG